MSDHDLNPIHIKISLQRLLLFWERLWTALHWPLLVGLLVCAVFWSGLMSSLPWPTPLIIAMATALAFFVSLKNLAALRIPPQATVLRKLESVNALSHREASSLSDTLVEESDADDIWREHQRRKLSALKNLRVAAPRSLWRRFDPMALRVPAVMMALAAWFIGTGDFASGVRSAANIAAPIQPKPLTLDAWLKPPAYTGKRPMLLTSAAIAEKLKTEAEILIPENSVLNLRLQNATKPHVEVLSGDKPAASAKIKTESSDHGFIADMTLDRPVTVRVMDGDKELARYPISTIADAAPKIEFSEDPKAEGLGKLSVKWKTSDDYGVKSVTAEISLADEQQDGTGFEGNGVFLYDPPDFKIPMKKPGAKDDKETTVQDLSAHPWAGLYVEMILTAKDAAGHVTSTRPKRFKLPERMLFKPLAQALQEQRRKIILSPDDTADVATILSAIMLYPRSIRDNSGLILQIDAVTSHLANSTGTDDVVASVKDLWPLILAVEDGKLNDLRAELKNLKEQLEQALKDGAPQERIDELTKRLREAMNKYLDQMQKEGQKRAADGTLPKQNGKSMSREDLQKMLDAIEKMSKNGSRDGAQQLLSELDKLLQNLQPGMGQQQQQGGDPQMMDKLDGLGQLLDRQQQLMDDTQRLGDGQQGGDQGDGKGKTGEGLAEEQRALKDMLDRLGRGLGDDIGKSLGQAGKDMDQSQNNLRGGQHGQALKDQGDAMKNLRDGMRKLSDQINRDGQGQQNADGQGKNRDDDPLGRPWATKNPGIDKDRGIVPSELAMRRAREILEQLRNRSNEMGLDDTTKAYIERLLKGMY